MNRFLLIGGGIVGLATARALLETFPDASIVLVEKESQWGFHQTGHNSGVIHSGIYYKPGSLKAKLCRDGNESMKRFCTENGVAYQNTGKIIVATEPAQLPALDTLYERGLANGVPVTRMTADRVRDVEPAVRCLAGLWVPSTAIVSYKEVCMALVRTLEAQGVTLMLGTKVERISTSTTGHVVHTTNGEREAEFMINCAGLHSDRVAHLDNIDPECKIVPFRGEYYELTPEKQGMVHGLVYPTPPAQFPFLGVHLTKMMDGSVHVGPNAVLSLRREGYGKFDFDLADALDTATYPGFWRLAAKHSLVGVQEIYRSLWKPAFVRDLQRMAPDIQEHDLISAGSGVRAQALRPDGGLVDDFLIVQNEHALHVCNAPSPAATASLEIGRAIVERIPRG